MADVAIDPQNSNPKELFGQGVRAYVLQDYDTAVRAFSTSSELLAIEHGNDTHDSLGDVYLYYGKALLELSRKESGPLGDGVLKNVEEGSESEEVEESEGEEDKKSENEAKAEEEVNGDTNKTDDQKTEETKPGEDSSKTGDMEESQPGDSAKSESSNQEAASSSQGSEMKPSEEGDNDGAGSSTELKDGVETEEELTDLQVAWEVLELAKRIFINRGGTEGKKNLAETLIVLGEISLESGNFPSAIEDMVEGLEIQKTLFGSDSRTIAETYYKLGTAYSTNAQIDEAIESFYASYEYLQNKVSSLKKEEEHKEANAEEIEEINSLIPEIQEKIADMKNVKAEAAQKATCSADIDVPKTNGAAEASSSKQVNDISHLVKRKRKEDGAQNENPAKRPSP